jgi:tetratricopeptide (TPR) repeat protein
MLSGDGRTGSVFAQTQQQPRGADRWSAYTTTGKELRAKGLYREAEGPLVSALEEAEKGGPSDARLPASLNNLGLLYSSQGRYAEAERFAKRSLEAGEKILPPDHPDVAAGLNTLALIYRDLGRYAEAERLFRRSLAISEKSHGSDTFRTAQP